MNPALEEIRAAYREKQSAIRDAKAARFRLQSAWKRCEELRVKHGLTRLKFWRLARGTNGARWEP